MPSSTHPVRLYTHLTLWLLLRRLAVCMYRGYADYLNMPYNNLPTLGFNYYSQLGGHPEDMQKLKAADTGKVKKIFLGEYYWGCALLMTGKVQVRYACASTAVYMLCTVSVWGGSACMPD